MLHPYISVGCRGEAPGASNGNSFVEDDPLMVLGLIKLFEMKGENCRVSDVEIDKIMQEMDWLG